MLPNTFHLRIKLRLLLVLLLILAAAAAVSPSNSVSASTKKKSKPNELQSRAISWAALQKQFPEHYFLHGPRDSNQVSLSFDDAPDERFTPQILDILAEHKIKATFFIVGDRALKHPELVKRILDEGHDIGNHSYDHVLFTKLTLDKFKYQINETNRIIKSITGSTPRFIRPPYGEINEEQMKWSKGKDFIIVNWDVDSEDWKNDPSSEQIIDNIKKTLQSGSIILQHAGGGKGQSLMGTIEALPKIIKLLQERGYEIVKISQLLDKPASL